ncbi:MAG: hypothetical protein ACRDFQ_07850 [Anaerolineales bacterium]
MATRKTKGGAARRSSGTGAIDMKAVIRWAFLGGLALAALVGLLNGLPQPPVIPIFVYYVLIALSLLTAFAYLPRGEELGPFLVAVVFFTFRSSFDGIQVIGPYLSGIAGHISFYLGFAAISVATRYIVDWYRSQ